jgi:hypothetical protein
MVVGDRALQRVGEGVGFGVGEAVPQCPVRASPPGRRCGVLVMMPAPGLLR